MPIVSYYVAASLDGFIAGADGGVDWLPQGDSEDYGYADFYGRVDALAMGRRTYDQVLGFGEWPYAGKATYVFTGNPPRDNPHGVEFVGCSAGDFVSDIASRYGGTIWLVGGANLALQFHRAGLIDEYLIHLIPVILGNGIPLLGGDASPAHLRLINSHTYDDGIVMLHYRTPSG